MWQEILRIRGTISDIKNAYVLFFSWTSESRKMQRFLEGVHRSGGKFQGGRYRWAYNDVFEFQDVPEFDDLNADVGEDAAGATKHDDVGVEYGESPEVIDAHSACSVFVGYIKDILKMGTSYEIMLREVSACARKAGMFRYWNEEVIVTLCCQVASTLVGAVPFAKARRRLILVFHPDMHQNSSENEKRLWNALTDAIAKVKDAPGSPRNRPK